ncbi:MAG: 2-hydroxyacid dehydrogenase [Candidatus Xenobiia bacterium LiM19]
MKPSILVTRLLPQKGMEMLRERYITTVNPDDRVMTREEILRDIKDKDGLLCLLTDSIDGEIMDSSSKLRIISNYAVGYNNIDVTAASERGIMVTNTPGVLTDTTADFAFALLLAIARRLPESERLARAGQFKGWGPMFMQGDDVHGKTLGIVGMGRIGKVLARRASGFDMTVIYHSTHRLHAEEELQIKASYASFEDLIGRSDFVSIHVPLSEHTHHLFGEKEFSMMKKSSYLINTSRGPVIDEKALVKALEKGTLKGAALDVYEHEPAIEPGLLNLENVILAPHVASSTIETRSRMAVMAAENLIAALEGRAPQYLVNRGVGRR